MKKYLLLLSMCILIPSAIFAQALGDTNNNGSIDIVDALLIAQYYVGLNPAGFVSSAADVNCSGSIDIVDALLIAQYYVGLIATLPCSSTPITTPIPTTVPTSVPTAVPTGEINVATFSELQTAIANATSGTVININTNSMSCNAQLVLKTENANVTIQAGSGYKPVLDFSGMGSLTGDSGSGISVKGSYYTFKNISLTKAPTKGFLIKAKMGDTNTASHNTFTNCSSSYNGDSGFSINTGDSSTHTNDGSKASYNTFTNCDSYYNADLAGSTGPGGNADGFSCKLDPGDGNSFFGCRAWCNSDDGFDLYNNNSASAHPTIIDTCWVWHSGDPANFGYTGSSWGGNGNGIKCGGGNCNGNVIVRNCVSFDINYGVSGSHHKAYDQNHQWGTVTLSNNVAYNSGYNYEWSDSSGTVIFSGTNYSVPPSSGDTFSCATSGTRPVAAAVSDFTSLATSNALAARQADGSLPNNGFGKHK